MPAIVVTCPHCGAVVPTLFGVAPGEDVTNAGFRGLAVACMPAAPKRTAFGAKRAEM